MYLRADVYGLYAGWSTASSASACATQWTKMGIIFSYLNENAVIMCNGPSFLILLSKSSFILDTAK
jgi:hypothetical protein